MDKVTIIIPSYNHSDYIEESLESCLNQTYQGSVEIIVIDDCSNDSTKEVLDKYLAYENVSVIYKKKNKGINDSIEVGLKQATGRYVQLLASDDLICEDKIQRQTQYLEDNPHLDCVYSRGYKYDGINRVEFFLDDFKDNYNKGRGLDYVSKKDWGMPLAQSGLYKTDVLKKISKVRQRYKSDDWAMLVVLFRDYNPGYYDYPLFMYRQHVDSTYKKYWFTLSMRMEVASCLVDEKFRLESIANIMWSHANFLINDGEKRVALRFFLASFFLCFKSPPLLSIIKSLLPSKLRVMIKNIFD